MNDVNECSGFPYDAELLRDICRFHPLDAFGAYTLLSSAVPIQSKT